MFEKLQSHYERFAVDLAYAYDGNCLFHAVSYMYGNRISAGALRCIACDFLSSQAFWNEFRDFLGPDWDAYVATMRRSGTWADGFVITALTRVLRTHITVVSGTFSQTFRYKRPTNRRLFLALEGSHYMPTRPMSEASVWKPHAR